jgi:hypothetical protein
VRGARRMSKTGNARLRVALVAVARKLPVLMTTLLVHERDFDPDWATHRRPS